MSFFLSLGSTTEAATVAGGDSSTATASAVTGVGSTATAAAAASSRALDSRKIAVQVFSDRIVVASPGYPPAPLTLAKLRKGNYRACSRNPVIARALATLKLMEQRGSGFARMRDAMLNHGLEAPAFAEQDGFFVITFPGPNGNYDRLKLSPDVPLLVSASVEAQLTERQRQMVVIMAQGESLTSRVCQEKFNVSAQALHRDFQKLVSLGIAKTIGSGRSARYILNPRE